MTVSIPMLNLDEIISAAVIRNIPQPQPGSIIDKFSLYSGKFSKRLAAIYSAIYCGVNTIPFSSLLFYSNRDSNNSMIVSKSVSISVLFSISSISAAASES